jgi:hypothetical protein
MFNGRATPTINLDPQFFEDLERELGPVFTLNEEQQLAQHRFSPAPAPLTQSLSSQLLQPFSTEGKEERSQNS